MGFINLGSVLKSVGSFIKPIAQSAIQAIAPAATSMLQGVVGDLFSSGKSALSNFLNVLPLPNPITQLAEKLLGKGMDALQNLAQGGIAKLIETLVGKLAPRTTSDGVTVTTPTVADRTTEISNNTPAAGTSSSSGAATGTGGAGGSSASSSAADGSSGNLGWSGAAPNPSKYDMTTPEGANKFQADMFKYQQAMNNIATFWQTMSNAFKSMSDTQKAIAGNIR